MCRSHYGYRHANWLSGTAYTILTSTCEDLGRLLGYCHCEITLTGIQLEKNSLTSYPEKLYVKANQYHFTDDWVSFDLNSSFVLAIEHYVAAKNIFNGWTEPILMTYFAQIFYFSVYLTVNEPLRLHILSCILHLFVGIISESIFMFSSKDCCSKR